MSDVLVFAVGVAISPIPIASMLLFLGGREPRLLGTSFALGWLVGVTAAVLALVAIVAATGATDDNPAWIAATQIALGLLFLAAAAVILARRDRVDVEPARWLGALDRLTAERCAGLGVFVSIVNPKNLALMLGAAIALAQADLGRSEELRSIVLFVAIACAGVAFPLAVYALSPARSHSALARLRVWLVRRQSAVLVVLGLVLGAKFLLDGVRAL